MMSDDILDELLDEIKQHNKTSKELNSNKNFELPKEKLEEYILNTSGRLIQDSLDMIDIVKDRVASAPEPDDVASLSELFKASTHTIEALNKILVQDKRTRTTLTVKQMDIESKKELLEADAKARLTASREEIIDRIVIDAETGEEIED